MLVNVAIEHDFTGASRIRDSTVQSTEASKLAWKRTQSIKRSMYIVQAVCYHVPIRMAVVAGCPLIVFVRWFHLTSLSVEEEDKHNE